MLWKPWGEYSVITYDIKPFNLHGNADDYGAKVSHHFHHHQHDGNRMRNGKLTQAR